jgi:integrase
MNIIKPNGRKLKYDLRVRNWDGRVVRIPGDRDLAATKRLGNRVETLIKAKQNGDPPPGELQTWIDNMPDALARRLVTLGLLEKRRTDRLLALADRISGFEKIVAARKSNTRAHAKRQATMVKKLIDALNVTSFDQITEDAVIQRLGEMKVTVATRRHYIIAMKDFAKCELRAGRATKNPVADLKPPGQYADPTIERVPLTVIQFQKLVKYLRGFDRYPRQIARWTAYERLLIYWTAVRTAFRLNELRSLRVRNLLRDAKPIQIVIPPGVAKNRIRRSVPIPTDLATALRAYVSGLDGDDRIFPFPTSNHSVLEMFRRDLDGAGIRWNFGDDSPETIDFHTLRSTAITWWLDVDGLTPKRVQILAGLKTLSLVAAYSRNLRLDEFGWLNKGPKLVPMTRKRSA